MTRYKNKLHEDWIHENPCIMARFAPCYGSPTQGHHLMRPWHGQRGMGLKANDRNLVPLCAIHHRTLHQRGDETAYFEEAAGDPDWGQTSAQFLWLTSPYYEVEDDI